MTTRLTSPGRGWKRPRVRRRQKLVIVIGAAAIVDAVVGLASCAETPSPEDVAEIGRRAVPIAIDKPYAADDYRFLDRAVGGSSVVQLGESLHITEEFPRIRLALIRYLHEQLGF